MHIFNVFITNVQSLKNVQPRRLHKVVLVYSKHLGKMTKFNSMKIFRKMPEHLQCVHYNHAMFEECLISLEVREELMKQSRYPL
jgi:hypothetical protein